MSSALLPWREISDGISADGEAKSSIGRDADFRKISEIRQLIEAPFDHRRDWRFRLGHMAVSPAARGAGVVNRRIRSRRVSVAREDVRLS